jgi:hypothetical protein
MLSLVSRIRSASRLIEQYKRELMFTAVAFQGQIPLPEAPITDGPGDPADARLLLQSSLTWVRTLAEHWAAPQLSTVMRSKGTLFLAAYVSTTTNPDLRRHHHRTPRSRVAAGKAVILRRPEARVVVRLVDACSQIAIHEDDLVAKLKDFRADHPILFDRLVSLLNHLHIEATA